MLRAKGMAPPEEKKKRAAFSTGILDLTGNSDSNEDQSRMRALEVCRRLALRSNI